MELRKIRRAADDEGVFERCEASKSKQAAINLLAHQADRIDDDEAWPFLEFVSSAPPLVQVVGEQVFGKRFENPRRRPVVLEKMRSLALVVVIDDIVQRESGVPMRERPPVVGRVSVAGNIELLASGGETDQIHYGLKNVE